MKIFKLENDAHINSIINETKYDTYLLQLSATWCAPCVRITPSVQNHISQITNEKCIYIYVDVDKCPNLYEYLKPNGIPAFIIMKHNKDTNLYDLEKFTHSDLSHIKQFLSDNDIYKINSEYHSI
jgi:thioredoxin-like negative regulator of GroEL